MTYTDTQIDAVARRIFTVTSDKQSQWGFHHGTVLRGYGLKYEIGSWDRASTRVKAYFRDYARRALRVA